MKVFELDIPRTGDEIHAGMVRLEREITGLIETVPVDEFVAAQGEHWSPERHLRHLAKSVRAVGDAMRLPRSVLTLRFGRPRRASRSFEEVVETYRAALVAGGRASGRFLPSDRPQDVAAAEWRDGVIDRWRRASSTLASAMERWSEASLDRHQVPHPLLGKMTMREILFFTLYHNAHHARRIAERRGS